MAPRCLEYLCSENGNPDIVIQAEKYKTETYPEGWPMESIAYMESARLFYGRLLDFDGFFLHASAVEYEGRAYLFSGPCGMGKSTHTRLWQKLFGESARVFNDDKPALRCIDGVWYAYGTPWCGKDGINLNMKVPLAGICFLKQSTDNRIRRLPPQEALARIISQTIRRFKKAERLELMLGHIGNLVSRIPVYELENRPETEAAKLSYETMCQGAKEMGL